MKRSNLSDHSPETLLKRIAELEAQVESLEKSESPSNQEIQKNHQSWLEHVLLEIPVPIYMVNPLSGRYVFGNKAMDELLGRHIPAQEDRSSIAGELVAFEEGTGRKMTLDEYPSSRAIRGEKVEDFKFLWRIRNRDYHVSTTACMIQEKYGNPKTVLVVVKDISEQVLLLKQIEISQNAAIEGHEQLQGFFMQSNIPMVILDGPDHHFILANPPYEKFIGRKAMGKTVAEVFDGGEAEIYKPILDKVYETGESFIGKELPIDLVDENCCLQNYFINIDYHAFKDKHGNTKGILAIVIDVSEQVKARKLIENSTNTLLIEKAKLDALVAESPSAIGLMKGKDLIFEVANNKWQELVSLGREYIGKSYSEIYPELIDTDAIRSIQHTFATGETFTANEMKLLVKSKLGILEDQYFDYTNVRILDSNGAPYGVFCYAHNVTNRVRNRIEIEENRKFLAITVENLEHERELRERFVLALTHDLRTPITALKMSAQLLSRKADDPNFVRTISKRIISSVDRADQMIRDLLDANRIKAGEKLPLQIKQTNMFEVIEETLAGLNVIHEDRFNLSSENKLIVGYWDKDSVQRVIENLASNAIKYGTDTKKVSVKLLKRDDTVEISIHNEGNPISLSEQQDIFNPFRRTSSAISGGQVGWGVGLTLVKGLVESHGGSVTVSSSSSQGTTFQVKLPEDSRKYHE
jgi:signal transduction histidine kinase